MISSIVDGIQFNFRAVAVIIDDGHVLLHRTEHDNFWVLPGGRVNAGEPSAGAIARELREEIGPEAEVHVGRLLWVIENFYRRDDARIHGVGMYYLVTLGASSPLRDKTRSFSGIEDDLLPHEGIGPLRLIFQWFPLDSIADMPLYPVALRSRICTLPATPELVTNIESGNATHPLRPA